jgi:hypothetical protein
MPFAMLYQGPNGEGHKSKDWKQFQRLWARPAAYKTYLNVSRLKKNLGMLAEVEIINHEPGGME